MKYTTTETMIVKIDDDANVEMNSVSEASRRGLGVDDRARPPRGSG